MMIALVAIVLINYAVYLPYMTYDDIWSTRFVLPAQIALFILLAAAASDAVIAVSRLARVLAIVCIVPVGIVAYEGTKYQQFDWPDRATAIGFTEMWYFAVKDRGRSAGELPPADVLQLQK